MTCFQCGMEGYIRSNCPYPKQQRERTESQGRQQVKSIASQDTLETPLTDEQKEIQELKERLRQAELAEAIENSRAVKLVIPTESGIRLGPTVYTPVEVNGVATDALVDTGSPATIVSLQFALKVFRQNRPEKQTEDELIKATRGRFKDPNVTLKNYGGHQLDFIA